MLNAETLYYGLLSLLDRGQWRDRRHLKTAVNMMVGLMLSLWLLAEALCFREPDDPAVEPADEWGAQIAVQTLVRDRRSLPGQPGQPKEARADQAMAYPTAAQRALARHRAGAGRRQPGRTG